jgi:hypothetical protein
MAGPAGGSAVLPGGAPPGGDPAEGQNGSLGLLPAGGTGVTGGTAAGTGGTGPALVAVGGNCDESELLAFPCAEGYGKFATGARGGEVYEVTNLDDAGSGSLRDGLSQPGRTVVFKVAGTIILDADLDVPSNTTLAGQTAPGGGITLRKAALVIDGDNVIIRYIRARYGDESQDEKDAVSMRYHDNVILDHVTASWGNDESMSIYHGSNVTVQWSIISETLNRGGNHGFGGIWGSPWSTHHHNLMAHNVTGNPRWASGCGNVDYRNNVVYNWGYASSYGGEAQQVGNDAFNFSTINMVANYYKPGPGTEAAVRDELANPSSRGDGDQGSWYVAGNVVEGSSAATADNWEGVQGEFIRLEQPWASMPINQQTAEDAYASVLDDVGCTRPNRDSLDARVIAEVRSGTAMYGANGVIESQNEVGGWPELAAGTAAPDADHDGMPDAWEAEKGLDPNDASDRNQTWGPGYTMLEMYLNSIDSF